MPIKVLIKRQFKEGHVNEIKKMLKEVRYDAMDHDGYISSETMWDYDNPLRVVVASNWRSIENWNHWLNSDLRKSIEKKFENSLAGKTEYEIFELGFYPHY